MRTVLNLMGAWMEAVVVGHCRGSFRRVAMADDLSAMCDEIGPALACEFHCEMACAIEAIDDLPKWTL